LIIYSFPTFLIPILVILPTFLSRLAVAAAIASPMLAAAQSTSLQLNCEGEDGPVPEAARIKALAPGIVMRTGKHQLTVKVTGKTLKFADKPPYDELGGVMYSFCDRKDGFILLKHINGDRFGGKLINEADGAALPGGGSVTFSPDKRAYFGKVQPDGLDGEEWSIYAVDGRRSWTGFSFIPNPKKQGYMSATLTDERWEANGTFTAQATCIPADKITWRVKLVNNAGKWDWRPTRRCPE